MWSHLLLEALNIWLNWLFISGYKVIVIDIKSHKSMHKNNMSLLHRHKLTCITSDSLLTCYESHSRDKRAHPGCHSLALLEGTEPFWVDHTNRLWWAVGQELSQEAGHHNGPAPAPIQGLSNVITALRRTHADRLTLETAVLEEGQRNRNESTNISSNYDKEKPQPVYI